MDNIWRIIIKFFQCNFWVITYSTMTAQRTVPCSMWPVYLNGMSLVRAGQQCPYICVLLIVAEGQPDQDDQPSHHHWVRSLFSPLHSDSILLKDMSIGWFSNHMTARSLVLYNAINNLWLETSMEGAFTPLGHQYTIVVCSAGRWHEIHVLSCTIYSTCARRTVTVCRPPPPPPWKDIFI